MYALLSSLHSKLTLIGTFHNKVNDNKFHTHIRSDVTVTTKWQSSQLPNTICLIGSEEYGVCTNAHFNSHVSGTQTVNVDVNPIASNDPSYEKSIHEGCLFK